MSHFQFVCDDGRSIISEVHCVHCFGQKMVELNLFDNNVYEGWVRELPSPVLDYFHDRWLSEDETKGQEQGAVQ